MKSNFLCEERYRSKNSDSHWKLQESKKTNTRKKQTQLKLLTHVQTLDFTTKIAPKMISFIKKEKELKMHW